MGAIIIRESISPHAQSPRRIQPDGEGKHYSRTDEAFRHRRSASPGASTTPWPRIYITAVATVAQRLCGYSKLPKVNASIIRVAYEEWGCRAWCKGSSNRDSGKLDAIQYWQFAI